MKLCIILEPREQDGSMYPIRRRSRMKLCIILEPWAGWIYVFS